MKRLEETVELTGSSYYTMLRSVIETIPRESSGDLLGRKLNKDYICINAYPIQTAKRKPNSVRYDDYEAVKRVRALNKAVNILGGLGTYLLGGYHSHVCKNGNVESVLSEGDIKHIKDELDELSKNYWIEITLNIRERKYQKPKKTGEFVIRYPRKLRVILRDEERHGYDITFAAYKVTNLKKPRIKELKVRRRKVKVTPLK